VIEAFILHLQSSQCTCPAGGCCDQSSKQTSILKLCLDAVVDCVEHVADCMARHSLSLQLVVDSQGEIYGCWPTNRPAVNLWSNLPATAQLRSPSYQKRYQQWFTKVSEVVPGTNKVLDVSQGFAQLSFLYRCACLVVHPHVFALPAVLTISLTWTGGVVFLHVEQKCSVSSIRAYSNELSPEFCKLSNVM